MKVEYDKIVRDNVPELITSSGKKIEYIVVNDKLKFSYLIKKAHEEIQELADSRNIEEIADVLEVMDAIIDYLKFNKKDISVVKNKKAKTSGKFKKGIVLKSVY